MQKIISRLLKKGNVAMGTQTDAVEGLLPIGSGLVQVTDFGSEAERETVNIASAMDAHTVETKSKAQVLASAASSRPTHSRYSRPLPNANHVFGLVNQM